jgi:hypothetical protein
MEDFFKCLIQNLASKPTLITLTVQRPSHQIDKPAGKSWIMERLLDFIFIGFSAS